MGRTTTRRSPGFGIRATKREQTICGKALAHFNERPADQDAGFRNAKALSEVFNNVGIKCHGGAHVHYLASIDAGYNADQPSIQSRKKLSLASRKAVRGMPGFMF